MNSDGIDRTIIGWRAWYTDGRVFTSAETTWEALPEEGVLGVMLYQKSGGRRVCAGRSLYWIERRPGGTVYCHDDAADAIISQEAKDKGLVKRGVWVTDTEMGEVEIAMSRSVTPTE